MKAFLIGLVVVIIIGGGGYLAVHSSSNKSSNQQPATTSSSQSSNSSSNSTSTNETAANTITFDGNKFSPATLTVRSGATVTIKNTSSDDLQFDSDPHPAHTDDTDLNVGIVSSGSSQTFTVTKKGTFGYHDHLDASIRGEITVE